EALQAAVRSKDTMRAEREFAAMAQTNADEAFNALLYAVQDHTDVHRVVLPYRAWDLLGLIGQQHAHTLLRQSVRYCLKAENQTRRGRGDAPRTWLPKLCDQYKLAGRTPGNRVADDAWVESLSRTIFDGTPEQAADAVAAAMADGFAPATVGEAISLAA